MATFQEYYPADPETSRPLKVENAHRQDELQEQRSDKVETKDLRKTLLVISTGWHQLHFIYNDSWFDGRRDR